MRRFSVGRVLILCVVVLVGVGARGGAVSDQEIAMLDLMNRLRAESDLCWNGEAWQEWADGDRELVLSGSLSLAASRHNSVMEQEGCFEHTCPGEAGLPERVMVAGYPAGWRFLSENIGGGFGNAGGMFEAWKASEGHLGNMLGCFARAVGIDIAEAPSTPFVWLWTVDFGDLIERVAGDAETVFLQFFDANFNGLVDDGEILNAISVWILGGVVGGHALDDTMILRMIALWVGGGKIGNSGS
ncbi:MAG: CAP domain-containing protein [Bacteroidetes bacterium]|nr:MAG: CAP domain-containing protein [Bacteroidota bacterium]